MRGREVCPLQAAEASQRLLRGFSEGLALTAGPRSCPWRSEGHWLAGSSQGRVGGLTRASSLAPLPPACPAGPSAARTNVELGGPAVSVPWPCPALPCCPLMGRNIRDGRGACRGAQCGGKTRGWHSGMRPARPCSPRTRGTAGRSICSLETPGNDLCAPTGSLCV